MRFASVIVLFFMLAGSAVAGDVTLPPKPADQLDKLFGHLHDASAADDADKTVADIWSMWNHNSSPTAEVLLSEASAAMGSHEYDAAEQILIQLIESYPDFAEGWNRRATLYFMEQRYDASLVDIEHVLALEPRHFGALAGKAAILRAQHKDIEALKVLKETLVINPHMASVVEAIKELEKAQPDI